MITPNKCSLEQFQLWKEAIFLHGIDELCKGNLMRVFLRIAVSFFFLISLMMVSDEAYSQQNITGLELREKIEKHLEALFSDGEHIHKFSGPITYMVLGIPEKVKTLFDDSMTHFADLSGMEVTKVKILNPNSPPSLILIFTTDMREMLMREEVRPLFKDIHSDGSMETDEEYEKKLDHSLTTNEMIRISVGRASDEEILANSIISDPSTVKIEEIPKYIARTIIRGLIDINNSSVFVESLYYRGGSYLLNSGPAIPVWPAIDEAFVRAIYSKDIKHNDSFNDVREILISRMETDLKYYVTP